VRVFHRPTWLPAGYRDHTESGFDAGWVGTWRVRRPKDTDRPRLRGTTGSFRVDPTGLQAQLTWTERGQQVTVETMAGCPHDAPLTEATLLRVARGLDAR
jgi:hypothetical protein